MTGLSGDIDERALVTDIKRWGNELGFQQIGISDIDLEQAEKRLNHWLDKGFHGEMGYMSAHGLKRSRPPLLVKNTASVITARLDYLPEATETLESLLDHPSRAYVSRYALGRDYHKVLRSRLKRLAAKIEAVVGPFGHRVFVDSAPVLEKPLAEKAGLGWIGKHTNLLNRDAGSWFFLGELYVDIALPGDAPETSHCGTCTACIDVCPTQAITAPYQLDARRCIAYLTIEHEGAIPEEFREAVGDRLFGCDECLDVCPWNRWAVVTQEARFAPRDLPLMREMLGWGEAEFTERFRGSPMRRLKLRRFKRNICVVLGNVGKREDVPALEVLVRGDDAMLAEHASWALERIGKRS